MKRETRLTAVRAVIGEAVLQSPPGLPVRVEEVDVAVDGVVRVHRHAEEAPLGVRADLAGREGLPCRGARPSPSKTRRVPPWEVTSIRPSGVNATSVGGGDGDEESVGEARGHRGRRWGGPEQDEGPDDEPADRRRCRSSHSSFRPVDATRPGDPGALHEAGVAAHSK